MAKLVIHQPDGAMREVRLDRDRITIGRRPDHDLCLPFPAVSADHAEIITVAADSFLHDIGSTNGTLVNGSRVTKHFLRDHDRIDIGRQHLIYLSNDAETVEPLPPDVLAQELRSLTERVRHVRSREAVSDGRESRAAIVGPVDELLTDLMEMQSDSTVAVDMPPTVSVVPATPGKAMTGQATSAATTGGSPSTATIAQSTSTPADPNSGAYIEVMSGPNAGQITPMTKAEFVFGKAGSTVAVIRRNASGYRLLPLHGGACPTRNGQPIDAEGVRLEFGDTIGVGGVTLRFNRRKPL